MTDLNKQRLLFILFFVVSIFWPPSSNARAQDGRKIRLAYSALSLSFLPHLFAKETGIFGKHGLDVDLVQIAGPIQVAALASGELDFGGAVSPVLFAASRGLPLRGVMIAVKTPLFYIVSQPAIGKLQDLNGKKMAVDTIGALQHIAAKAMLRKKGVNPDKISYIQTGSVSNSVAALSSEAVDAALLSIPHNVVMAQKGFHQLVSTPEAGVNYPPSGLSVHVTKLQKDSIQIKRMISALVDSLQSIEANKAAATGYIERRWKLTPKLAEETYRLVLPTLPQNGRMTLEEVQEFLDAAFEGGQIQKRTSSAALMDYGPLDELLKQRRER